MFSSSPNQTARYYSVLFSVLAGMLWAGNVAQAALINHYQGEGNADDSVGGIHGDWIGNEAYGTGQVGQAFNFDGDTDADTGVEFTLPVIPTTGDWSIMFWMKSTSVSGLAVPVSQGHANFDGLAFQFGAWYQPVLAISGLNDAPSLENDTIQYEDYLDSDTTWRHVALTHDSTTMTNTMYLDGGLANAQIYNEDAAQRPINPAVDMPDSTWQAPFTNVAGNPSPLRFGDDVQNPNRNWNGLLDEVRIYDNVLSESEIANICQCEPLPDPTDYTWTADGLGDWSVGSNWDPGIGAPPNTNLQTASFGSDPAITKPTVAVVTSPVTVNRIEFDNTISYGIGGLETLTLQGSTETPTSSVSVNQGSHQFQVEVSLDSNTDVFVQSGASLAFNLPLNLNGNTLAKTGDGTMAINNNLTTGGGAVDCQSGNCSGTGTIGGDLNNSGGTVAPGNSPGILTVDGNYTQGAGGTLALEVGGLTPGEQHDKLVVMGTADLNGTVAVELIDSFTPADNDQFDVLDFTTFVDSGYMFDFSAAMGAASWDTSLFESDGVLVFGAVGFSDFDNSGMWDLPDLNLVLFNWQQAEGSLPSEWVNQRPTTVGLESLNLVLFNWQQPSSVAVVPEPATAVLGLFVLVGIFICHPRVRS